MYHDKTNHIACNLVNGLETKKVYELSIVNMTIS